MQADLSHEAQGHALFSGNTGEGKEEAGAGGGEDSGGQQWRVPMDRRPAQGHADQAPVMQLRPLDREQEASGLGFGFGFRNRATIVFVGSTVGKYSEAMHADYAASKSGAQLSSLPSSGAVIIYADNYRRSQSDHVAPCARVNSVVPGWVRTPMASEALQDPQTVYRSLAAYARGTDL
ncbi:hypothetical protein BJY52DRAFT_1187275 [Lactarius psammicola]|nr:hypothetical protein BJY52DRAFT_1187275 [Lactarius psammicola]